LGELKKVKAIVGWLEKAVKIFLYAHTHYTQYFHVISGASEPIIRTICLTPGTVVHTWNLSTWEVEAEGLKI
jgi:hypothetical protein